MISERTLSNVQGPVAMSCQRHCSLGTKMSSNKNVIPQLKPLMNVRLPIDMFEKSIKTCVACFDGSDTPNSSTDTSSVASSSSILFPERKRKSTYYCKTTHRHT